MDVRKNAEREWMRRMTKSVETTEDKSKKKSAERKFDSPKKIDCNKNEGFNGVAGMEELKQLVTEGFINVLKYKDCADAYGIKPPSLLLYGPAGCGKTFFAEAIASEVGVNFMKVVPDDIASTLVHGTQEKIGEVFRKAEKNSPTILFFDEFDAMVPKRTNDDHGYQNGETNEFLCMLNNAAERGIIVLAATNHPERIDRAVLRTGRIDEVIFVDMPDKKARESLFRLSLSKIPSSKEIDYEKLAELTKGYNCSDISYIVKVASRKMFNECIAKKDESYKPITQGLLEEIISQKSPSVSTRDLQEFERVRQEFSPKDGKQRAATIGFHI